MGSDPDDLDDLIDSYVKDALRATDTREGEGRPEPAWTPMPMSSIYSELPVAAFAEEVPTATDMDAAEAIEELHIALSLELVPELPRVRFARSSVSPVQPFDLEDEITSVHVRAFG
ncbi:hypothetical protein BH11MYX3_BH11MYX3_15450 [soil metagenome]